jgi:hypothetical protein
VFEGGADVSDGGLAVLHVEGRGFEEDVGLGGGEPGADIASIVGLAPSIPQALKPGCSWLGSVTAEAVPFPILIATGCKQRRQVQAVGIGEPS